MRQLGHLIPEYFASLAGWASLVVCLSTAYAGDPQAQNLNQLCHSNHSTAKPWVYWYWMGGLVDKPGITRHMERYQAVGIGGVHIVPVYGPYGAESRYVPFLSPLWVDLLNHTCVEAKRLDMGVDMTCGTGWPFGGPWVKQQFAASQYTLENFSPDASLRVTEPIRTLAETEKKERQLVVAIAYGPNDESLDLTNRVDSSGKLDWQAPSSDWRLTALFSSLTNLPVERAAPGGEGLTIDYFRHSSLKHYLGKFETELAAVPDRQLRAFYHDSYENWGQNWTPQLFEQFQTRRGYDLRAHLPKLSQVDQSDEALRVRTDFRETMADLIYEEFTLPWVDWVHARHISTRNEGHGSPGNPLDLYAAADIPETEVYGTTWLDPLGLKPLPGVPEHDGGAAEIQLCKLASSAAHIAGRPLCSSETCTWLGEHFKIPLEHMKCQVDLMFVMGVNHIFFHGAAYSPDDAGWPGWLWYAATNIGTYMPAWDHMPTLCNYIACCQSCLQSGQHDNDTLVYFPIYDLWASDEGSRDNLQYIVVHATSIWLDKLMPGFAEVTRTLWDRGYSYDSISDRQIASLAVDQGQLVAAGGRYKVLVIPSCRLMPEGTLKHIHRLVESGATIISHKVIPADVPGLRNLSGRRDEFRKTADKLMQPANNSTESSANCSGRFLLGDDLEKLLSSVGIRRESMMDSGLKFVRRREKDGWVYFIVNHSGHEFKDFVSLAVPARSALLLDPMTGAVGKAESQLAGKVLRIFLNLQPRQSIIVRADRDLIQAPYWEYVRDDRSETLAGPWNVEFVAGGPSLPTKRAIDSLSDWTTWVNDREQLRSFSGSAKYSIEFNLQNEAADHWTLDLGEVCHSASVRLNGQNLGTLITSPFRLDATAAVRQGLNHLEVEVINLPANRVAALDRKGEDWQKCFFVDIHYRSFDASKWSPLRSGLIGPVKLIVQKRLHSSGSK